ncbi:putative membrane protein [Bacillus fengqiuensis]|nr:putative membrane protein [Bacillus fengqiuensis]
MKQTVLDVLTLQFMPCHRKRERSLVIKGKQFPVCFRCMSILMGYIAVIPLYILSIAFPIYVAVLLNIPMLIDGYTQLKGWRESSNLLRMVTGLMSGIGQAMFIVTISLYVVRMLQFFI